MILVSMFRKKTQTFIMDKDGDLIASLRRKGARMRLMRLIRRIPGKMRATESYQPIRSFPDNEMSVLIAAYEDGYNYSNFDKECDRLVLSYLAAYRAENPYRLWRFVWRWRAFKRWWKS